MGVGKGLGASPAAVPRPHAALSEQLGQVLSLPALPPAGGPKMARQQELIDGRGPLPHQCRLLTRCPPQCNLRCSSTTRVAPLLWLDNDSTANKDKRNKNMCTKEGVVKTLDGITKSGEHRFPQNRR